MRNVIQASSVCLLAGLTALTACRDNDRALGTERDRRDPIGERGVGAPPENYGSPAPYAPPGQAPAADTALGATIGRTVDSIAEARCNYAQRCNLIGAGDNREFASRESCLADEKKELSDGLNVKDCRGGIVQDEVNECLTEIKNRDCGSPFDALGSMAACRTSDMCRALP